MATADDFITAVGRNFGDFTLAQAENGQVSADSTGEQMVGPFPFCVTFQGKEIFTLNIMAPSPEAAADTAAAMVRAANQSMPGWGVFVDACPSGV